jgi:hypothetical protein
MHSEKRLKSHMFLIQRFKMFGCIMIHNLLKVPSLKAVQDQYSKDGLLSLLLNVMIELIISWLHLKMRGVSGLSHSIGLSRNIRIVN